MNITKMYIGFYKLRKCLLWQFKNINIMAIIIIILLSCIAIFQQIYYPRIIEQDKRTYKKQIEYLQFTFSNVTNSMEDLKLKIEDYNTKDWNSNIKDIRLLIDILEEKISYYESSIANYFSPGRMKRQKLIF
jgi:predicted PurR-regulated permease PerM